MSNGRVLLFTWIGFVEDFWLLDYLTELVKGDEGLFPDIDRYQDMLGPVRIIPVPIPFDCTDGFLCAYWQRPEAYLSEDVRRGISLFSRIGDPTQGLKKLKADLDSGRWHEKYQHILTRQSMDHGYRLISAGV